jgi:hypothetical protein
MATEVYRTRFMFPASTDSGVPRYTGEVELIILKDVTDEDTVVSTLNTIGSVIVSNYGVNGTDTTHRIASCVIDGKTITIHDPLVMDTGTYPDSENRVSVMVFGA